jgi:hypothetical protein
MAILEIEFTIAVLSTDGWKLLLELGQAIFEVGGR